MKGLELLVSHKDEKKYVLIIGWEPAWQTKYTAREMTCASSTGTGRLSENWIPLMEGLRKLRTPRIWRR